MVATDAPARHPSTEIAFQPEVVPDWTDYNGHMNVAYYMRAADMALDACLSENGVGTLRPALAPAVSRVEYLQEVHGGKRLSISVQILALTPESLHLLLGLWESETGVLAAIAERIDMVSDWPEDTFDTLSALAGQHARLAVPEGWGALTLESE